VFYSCKLLPCRIIAFTDREEASFTDREEALHGGHQMGSGGKAPVCFGIELEQKRLRLFTWRNTVILNNSGFGEGRN
jgi:hypothetical protein